MDFSAAEARHYPSKPLRESQSRLLISTPSWTEGDSSAEKDKGQERCKVTSEGSRFCMTPSDGFGSPLFVLRCQQPGTDHRKRSITGGETEAM